MNEVMKKLALHKLTTFDSISGLEDAGHTKELPH
jgi:hypothetical protein